MVCSVDAGGILEEAADLELEARGAAGLGRDDGGVAGVGTNGGFETSKGQSSNASHMSSSSMSLIFPRSLARDACSFSPAETWAAKVEEVAEISFVRGGVIFGNSSGVAALLQCTDGPRVEPAETDEFH